MSLDMDADKDVGLCFSGEPLDMDLFGSGSHADVFQEGYSPGSSMASSVQPRLTAGYNVDGALDRSWQQLGNKPLQQFWEQGFWAEIFGPGSDATSSTELSNTLGLFRPTVPMAPRDADLEDDAEVSVGVHSKRMRHASYMDVVSNCTVQSWREQRDSMWETAVRRWHSCILSWDGDDAIVGLVKQKTDFKSQCQIVVDVLHNKAPATLLKRCNSISRLVNDLHRHGCKFPCTEDELYEYLCRQRESGAPCSRLKSLLEAVTFVRHMFGVESLDSCTKSRRCLGVATPRQVNVISQAPPLRVEHLLAVHHVIETDEDAWNVCFAGMVLFCIYGRARWGDAQHSQQIEWDTDLDGLICYVECSTAVHKTCRSLLGWALQTVIGLSIGGRRELSWE